MWLVDQGIHSATDEGKYIEHNESAFNPLL
jgi:hypothetical protein